MTHEMMVSECINNLNLCQNIHRDQTVKNILEIFIKAWNENPVYATKSLFYIRDINGKGEKYIGRLLMLIIKISNPLVYKEIILQYINLGCWKDILYLYSMSKEYYTRSKNEIPIDPDSEHIELDIIAKQLLEDNNSGSPSLCAKWAPSEGCHFDKMNGIVKKLIKRMNIELRSRNSLQVINYKEYRLLLTRIRSRIKIVETQLSRDRTHEIDFDNIPFKALSIYKHAFSRNTNSKNEIKQNREELKNRYLKYLKNSGNNYEIEKEPEKFLDYKFLDVDKFFNIMTMDEYSFDTNLKIRPIFIEDIDTKFIIEKSEE